MGLLKFIKKEKKTEDSPQQELLTEEKKDMIQGVEDLSQTTVKGYGSEN